MLDGNDRQWLNRISAHSAGAILLNQAKERLDRETLENFAFLLQEDGALVVWGSPDGLDEVFTVRHHAATDLYLAGTIDAPVADASIPVPKRQAVFSPSFPAMIATWAIQALSRQGDLVLGIGTIRGVVADVCRQSHRKGLELAGQTLKVEPPDGGWEGYPELTNEECLARFQTKWVKNENGCHIWQGKPDQDGYGRYSAIGVQYKAHRYAYCAEFGPLNPVLTLGHECVVRLCVNPYHLHAEPQEDNTAEMWRDKRLRERAK
ncbi:hypothetical protein [Nitrospira defluvii]|uniref:HNH nuclease domain-containing protein n=1 Tax=Nitrospira defluvii TaxID=330214 RepID=A0ABM8RYU8_9BACT|nr:hypothetical protein [Nitrospira defluvii]CAE6779363.1 conserved hypothetical protein [Nitrospira defluvii]